MSKSSVPQPLPAQTPHFDQNIRSVCFQSLLLFSFSKLVANFLPVGLETAERQLERLVGMSPLGTDESQSKEDRIGCQRLHIPKS